MQTAQASRSARGESLQYSAGPQQTNQSINRRVRRRACLQQLQQRSSTECRRERTKKLRHAVAALMLGKPATEADILNRWSNPAARLRTAAFASLLFAVAFLIIYALARALEAVFERFQRRKQR